MFYLLYYIVLLGDILQDNKMDWFIVIFEDVLQGKKSNKRDKRKIFFLEECFSQGLIRKKKLF